MKKRSILVLMLAVLMMSMVALVACGSSTLTITFDSQGGSSVDSVVVEDDEYTAPTDPTLAGYTFGGWYTDKDCTTAWSYTAGSSGEVTVYAKWVTVVTTEDGLTSALKAGGDVELGGNITLTQQIVIGEEATTIFNTNDYTVTYQPADDYVEVAIVNYGNLTINGEEGTNAALEDADLGPVGWNVIKDATNSEFVGVGAHVPGLIDNIGTLEMNNVTFYSADAINSNNKKLDYYSGTDLLALVMSHGGEILLNDVNSLAMASDTADAADIGLAAFRTEISSEVPTDKVRVDGGVFISESREASRTSYAFTVNAYDVIVSPDKVFGWRSALALNGGHSIVAGGDYYGCYYRPLYFSGDRAEVSTTISGGSFTKLDKTTLEPQYEEQVLYIANTHDSDGGENLPATCTIEGGTFNGYIYINTPLGSLEVSGGTFNDISLSTNQGTIFDYVDADAEEANITLASDYTISEDITIPSNVIFNVSSGVTLTAPDSIEITNNGTIVVQDGGTFANSATISGSGSVIDEN